MQSSPIGELHGNEPKDSPGAPTPVTLPSSEGSASPPNLTLESPDLYINRELSLLQFQRRVLEQAQDPGNPLLERVKFLSIVSSNLDEFFMVRVAGLQEQAASGLQEASVDGLPAAIQLQRIRQEVRQLVEEIQDFLRDTLLPALEREGVRIADISSLTPEERSAMDTYFLQHVFPVLTPLAFDPGRPFPHISGGSLNLAVVVGDNQGTENFARVKVPDSLLQLVPVISSSRHGKTSKPSESERVFVWLEQLITTNLHLLFPGMEIVEAYPFRVTRDAEVAVQELESDDLLESVEEAIRKRRFTSVVRLQVPERHNARSQTCTLLSFRGCPPGRRRYKFQNLQVCDCRRNIDLHEYSPAPPAAMVQHRGRHLPPVRISGNSVQRQSLFSGYDEQKQL
jgi:polyphosphate kinase